VVVVVVVDIQVVDTLRATPIHRPTIQVPTHQGIAMEEEE